jgi:hypothetical protein
MPWRKFSKIEGPFGRGMRFINLNILVGKTYQEGHKKGMKTGPPKCLCLIS